MTDLKGQLEALCADEPPQPTDLERIVGLGRRARRRRNAALAAAGTLGVAGMTAAVVIPLALTGDNEPAISVAVQPPPPVPTAAAHHCEFISTSRSVHGAIAHLRETGKFGPGWSFRKLKAAHGKTAIEICRGHNAATPPTAEAPPPAGPPYHYAEQPAAIASRLGTHLQDRVTALGLSITYTRPFAQESTTLEKGKPAYFGGNVDVHEAHGYGDIGVQVTHGVTEQVPFTGSCTAADQCEQTTLPDGSVLRTGRVEAGGGDTVLTAEVHRPDGVVVQAQESDYPFGPDAATEGHGAQPLTPDQLVSLAEDGAFTF